MSYGGKISFAFGPCLGRVALQGTLRETALRPPPASTPQWLPEPIKTCRLCPRRNGSRGFWEEHMGSLDCVVLSEILWPGTVRCRSCRSIPSHTGLAGRCIRGWLGRSHEQLPGRVFPRAPSNRRNSTFLPRRLLKRRTAILHVTTRCWDYRECFNAGAGWGDVL